MDLLKHPVTESFLHLKNTQVGWLYLASNLAFYLTFLLSITGLIFTNHSSWFITVLAGSQTAAHTTFLSLTLVCLVLFILIEIFKVIVIFDINLDNAHGYFSWLLVLTISTVYTAIISDPESVSPATSQQLAALVIAIVWVYVLVVLAIFPFLGIYLLMLKKVALALSSFLALLLNELDIKTGKIPKFTKFGYASQEPWIITGTIRDNIIMKRHFDEERYREILRVTCLEADLLKFPAGDMAYIGDRGITLSGGQKARVGLARAIYEDAEIYLLDDPLGRVSLSFQL